MNFTKKQKQEMISRVPYWWHHVDVGNGIITPGKQGSHPMVTKGLLQRIQLPASLKGKTVLDLGCADGFFSFECERRGADKVVALDRPGCNCVQGFKVLHRIFNSRVEYVQANVLELSSREFGKFDIVLFLGLLYHLRYPLKGLDVLRDLTKELAVIETDFYVDSDASLMRYTPPLNSNDHCTWSPSRKCLEQLFKNAGLNFTWINTQDSRIIYHLT